MIVKIDNQCFFEEDEDVTKGTRGTMVQGLWMFYEYLVYVINQKLYFPCFE